MFLHKLMSLPSGSVSRDIFIKKLILFVNDQSCVTLGFIPDICKMLFKYDLHDIVNNLLSPLHVIPSKYEWKSRVKSSILRCETDLWDQRMAASNDFIFFRILHPTIEPSIVYTVCNNSMHRDTRLVIARLWTRSVNLKNQLCSKCDSTFQDELVHVICECPYTAAARIQFTDSLDNILLPVGSRVFYN